MKRILLALCLLFPVVASALDKDAILAANEAEVLHNTVAEKVEHAVNTIQAKPKRTEREMDLLKRMEIFSLYLGSYRMAYKKYCTILQATDMLERKASRTPDDEANLQELHRALPENVTKMRGVSRTISNLADKLNLR